MTIFFLKQVFSFVRDFRLGLTIYIWGDPETIPDEDIELTCRVHDECNGSDVFGR